MDYREQAKELLRRRRNLLSAQSAIEEELILLEREREVCSKRIDEAHDDETYIDRLVGVLADLDDCRFRKSIVERELLKLRRGLEGLDDYQRDLLISFYCECGRATAEEVMDKWFKERSTVYRDKQLALDRFTRSVYGVLQI